MNDRSGIVDEGDAERYLRRRNAELARLRSLDLDRDGRRRRYEAVRDGRVDP